MKLLVAGASGLLGSHLRHALRTRGHEVIGVARHSPGGDGSWLALDLAHARQEDWTQVLAGVDCVVNCVGIFRESPGQSFEALHHRGPARLFDACVEAGVRRVVQISALGADEHAVTEYHLSKRAADEHLLRLPLDAVVAQPSLVFAPDGSSAKSMLTWASLPVVPLPAGGQQTIQPIALDDLTNSLVALATGEANAAWGNRRVPLVGPVPISLAHYLAVLRQGIGLQRSLTVNVPGWAMRIAASTGDHLGRWIPSLMLDSASWQMLQQGNQADPAQVTELLGGPPLDASRFVDAKEALTMRTRALLGWLLPLARVSLALVWIVTAVVSAFVFPVAESLDLLARSGLPEPWRLASLYAAALLDMVLGLATLGPPKGQRWRPWLWRTQAALILFYTGVITLRLPEFWAHPYGPLLKNLPMLALIAFVASFEPRRRPP